VNVCGARTDHVVRARTPWQRSPRARQAALRDEPPAVTACRLPFNSASLSYASDCSPASHRERASRTLTATCSRGHGRNGRPDPSPADRVAGRRAGFCLFRSRSLDLQQLLAPVSQMSALPGPSRRQQRGAPLRSTAAYPVAGVRQPSRPDRPDGCQWCAARCAASTSSPKSAVGSRHTECAWFAPL
jgi:hypothetical protein